MTELVILALLFVACIGIGMWFERQASLSERIRRRREFWAKQRKQSP